MAVSKVAAGLLRTAQGQPASVLDEARSRLESASDPDDKAVLYRAMSLAARNASTLEESIEYAEAGARVAADDSVRRECLITLAGSLSDAGQLGRASRVLDEASKGASGLVAGQVEFQKGTLRMEGATDLKGAERALERALEVFANHERHDFAAMALHNLGWIHTQTGRFDDAESSLRRARTIEEQLGRHMEVSGTDNNLGILASYRGDIPEALRRLAMSDQREMEHAGTNVPRHVTRAEILISAGLFHEALGLAKQIAGGARSTGRAEDEADAVLVAARAAVLANELNEAEKLARRSIDMFQEQGRDVLGLEAEGVLIEALHASTGSSAELLKEAVGVARHLADASLPVAAHRASLLAGRIALDLNDFATARQEFEGLGDGRSGPIELRVHRWQAKAMLRLAEGNTRGADAAARAGLDVLESYQTSLGASDLRSGIERQGRELGDIGLRLARDSADARRLFRWMERTRGRALRYDPVVPRDDDPEQPLLADLRRLTAELRKVENRDNAELIRRRRRLQDQLRARNRARERHGVVAGVSIDDLAEGLGSKTLVELGEIDGSLVAVVVRRGRFRIEDLGDVESATSSLRRLRFAMRRTARLSRGGGAVKDDVSRFDDLVLGRLDNHEGEVILVPWGPLLAAPWNVMPSLANSVVTVAPSADMWWRAHNRSSRGKGVVLAAGPDLEHASAEIEALRNIYTDATVHIGGQDAQDFAKAISGKATAHAACHAAFEVENPMFSSLRLSDGDFNVYDMERLEQSPEVVVLSACDSGYTEARAGDELTGLTSAMLSMGARSVVASVGLVPDSAATSDLMVGFHRLLVDGLSPSAALTASSHDVADDPEGYLAAASFIAVGGI